MTGRIERTTPAAGTPPSLRPDCRPLSITRCRALVATGCTDCCVTWTRCRSPDALACPTLAALPRHADVARAARRRPALYDHQRRADLRRRRRHSPAIAHRSARPPVQKRAESCCGSSTAWPGSSPQPSSLERAHLGRPHGVRGGELGLRSLLPARRGGAAAALPGRLEHCRPGIRQFIERSRTLTYPPAKGWSAKCC